MNIKQGIQLYTVRELIQTFADADKTFAAIKGFGCDVIQISGIGPIEPVKVRALVEKYGFDVCVTHKPFDRMCNDLDALLDEHLMIGCTMMGLGSMPDEYRTDPQKAEAFARKMNEIGEASAKKGVTLAYHNHDFEFKTLSDGRTLMDILLTNTDPSLVNLIPDVAWVQWAGVDPCEFLTRVRDRVKVVHMKDYIDRDGSIRFVEFGDGAVDFNAIYKTCAALGIPYAVYEQDSGWSVDPLESCRVSFERMLATAAQIA